MDVLYSEIAGEEQTKAADREAFATLGGKRTGGPLSLYKAKIGWKNEDIRTSFGRVIFHYRLDRSFNVLGEIRDHYTFLDTRSNENKGVPFPHLNLYGWACCWKGGDHISDIWMGDLERYGYAKSFLSHIEWTVTKPPSP